jgi:DNA-binding beta-propeller fold protein YncE
MKRTYLAWVLSALAMAGAVEEIWSRNSTLWVQASEPHRRSLPTFEVDRKWPKVPAKWKLGDVSSVTIDAHDNVWVLHRPRTLKPEQAALAAPPVIVFDTAGNYIKAWGGAAIGYEWPQREHGIYIDYKGFVWLGGNYCPSMDLPGLKPVADDQLLKFTQDGNFVMQIGRSNQSKGNTDTRNLHRPADVWVYPPTNELFVADGYGNHRIAVFDADSGAFKRMWGAFGNNPINDDHCQIITPSSFSDPGPEQFSIIHAIRVAQDGTVYVADREYRRVQTFTKDGKFLKQLVKTDIPFARNLTLSPDVGQQFLYVGGGDGVFVLDRKTLEIVSNIQTGGGVGAGHQIAADSKGNLYVAQPAYGLQKLTFKGVSPAAR